MTNEKLEKIRNMAVTLALKSYKSLTEVDLKTLKDWGIEPATLKDELTASYYTAMFGAFQQVTNTLFIERSKTGHSSELLLCKCEDASMLLVEDTYKKTIWALENNLSVDNAENARKMLHKLVTEEQNKRRAEAIEKQEAAKRGKKLTKLNK